MKSENWDWTLLRAFVVQLELEFGLNVESLEMIEANQGRPWKCLLTVTVTVSDDVDGSFSLSRTAGSRVLLLC